jgi:hypothetical protein
MTSTVTGTATDNNDLWTKLLAFLKTDSALVAAGENWTQVWTAATGHALVLQGPGLAGSDQILIGLDRIDDAINDYHSIMIYGMTGVNASAVLMTDHVHVSRPVGFFSDGGAQTYWFTASGRRVAGVVQISTVFEAFYAGLFLPYALPTEYPYPLFIGGTRGDVFASTPPSWRASTFDHTNFAHPASDGSGSGASTPQAWFLDPQSTWTAVANNHATGWTWPTSAWAWMGPAAYGYDNNYFSSDSMAGTRYGAQTMAAWKGPALDGSYVLDPLTIVQSAPASQNFGVLDGVYFVPGFNNAAGNIVTVGGVSHLVAQNCFRTDNGNYIALQLS